LFRFRHSVRTSYVTITNSLHTLGDRLVVEFTLSIAEGFLAITQGHVPAYLTKMCALSFRAEPAFSPERSRRGSNLKHSESISASGLLMDEPSLEIAQELARNAWGLAQPPYQSHRLCSLLNESISVPPNNHRGKQRHV